MSIAVVGVNHRTAPLEVRERFAHAPRDVATSLERLRSAGAGGGVLLSTCNRTEFYIAEPAEAVPEAVWAILTERLGDGREASAYGYLQRDREAVRHLYRVSAGLDSLILGAGDIAELAASCLASEGVRVTLVANRTYERAQAIAEQLGGAALTLDEAWDHFASADIVLSSTAAPHAVVTWERVAPAIGRRRGRPLCILDLAVPRDVEPAVGQLENVFLYDIDDLQAVAAHAAAERHREIPAAERIVGDEVERFWAWYGGLARGAGLEGVRGEVGQGGAAGMGGGFER